MKLLQLCVMAAIAAGVTTGPHIARAQALGEAAGLSAGFRPLGRPQDRHWATPLDGF